jgi:hypothetical protein
VERLLDSIAVLSIGLVVLVLTSLRRAHIRVEYSVSWLLAGISLLVLSRSPWALQAAGYYLGLSDAPVVLLIVIGSVFLVVFYRFSIIISKLRDDNIALAQRVAILEYHIAAGGNSPRGEA